METWVVVLIVVVAAAAAATAAFYFARRAAPAAPPIEAPPPPAKIIHVPASQEEIDRAQVEARRVRAEAETQAAAVRQQSDQLRQHNDQLRQQGDQLRQQSEQTAQRERARIDSELREKRQRFDTEIQAEAKDHRDKVLEVERRLARKEAEAEKEQLRIEVREKEISSEKEKLEKQLVEVKSRDEQLQATLKQEEQKLLEIAQLTAQEARDVVMKKFEEECQGDLAKYLEKKEEERKERSEEIAQRIVGTAIQRCAVRYVSDTVVSVIDLPSDEMKGKIIGREGRNIRAIEKATGVDVIVDDTPGVIVISCFDAVRREIARRALEKLISDGRIHPARIEELIEAEKKGIDEDIRNTGKKVCADLGLQKVHPQIQFLVGRLKYRSSYGQNVLEHSIEIAHIMSSICAELKLDPLIGKRCGLLHDIGKAMTHELDGSHAVLGADQARRFDEQRLIWNAIGAHHEDMPYETTYAVLTQVGDAISAGRPGARRDSVEQYVERLEKLEATATSFEGVASAYAVQAGRELRVLVDADKMDDNMALLTARNIAKKIEDELTYPGEIKVTLIRERKVTEIAR
ncbi:MAG: ribonuclease Y [Planctomycetes bacterium]|nr:ribonuclease Y [Planctomycetota bacterium]